MTGPAATVTLVVGCGSDLRGDDRVGRIVADRIAEQELSGVRVRSVVQLLPELAVDVAAADRVIVVDADVTVDRVRAALVPDQPADGSGFTHHRSPASLLELASALGRVPDTMIQVSVPARRFDLGDELSDVAARAVDEATALVLGLLSDRAGDLLVSPSPRR